MNKIFQCLLFIWFILNVFNAPIRYYFNIFGISWLIYIGDAILIAVISYGFLLILRSMRINKYLLIIVGVIVFSMFIGFVNQLNFYQILFGVKIFLPLLAGLLIMKYNILQWNHLIILYRIFIPIIVLGMVLEYFSLTPWTGFSYDFGGFNIEGNREWTTFGLRRLSGFQRASFETAMLLLFLDMFYLLSILHYKNKMKLKWKIYDSFIFVLSIVGIIYTTSKTIILAELTLIIIFGLIIVLLKIKNKLIKILFVTTIKLILLSVFVIGILPPFFSLVYPEYVNNLVLSENFFIRLVFSSYLDRMEITWPNAYSLLSDNNYFNFMGRGLGGIGTAQRYFEPNHYNPGDNIFVYLYILIGWIIVIFILWLIFNLLRIKLNQSRDISLLFFLLAIFSVGATLNGLESPTFTLSIGVLLSSYYHKTNQQCVSKGMNEGISSY